MIYMAKFIWRFFSLVHLQKKDVHVKLSTLWNRQTSFDGSNVIGKRACIGNSKIGRHTFICEDTYLPDCKIGSFCSIARDVRVIRYTHPSKTFVSTSPVFFSTVGQCGKTFVKENKFCEQNLIDGYAAIIGNDVWIGEGVRIIEGVRIGDGAIVAAGAYITKNVSPYTIVGGVPAKKIRMRFTDEEIIQLQCIKWWEKDDEWLERHANEFCAISDFLNNVKSNE